MVVSRNVYQYFILSFIEIILLFKVFFSVMSGSTALGTALPFLSNIATAIGAGRNAVETINRVCLF